MLPILNAVKKQIEVEIDIRVHIIPIKLYHEHRNDNTTPQSSSWVPLFFFLPSRRLRLPSKKLCNECGNKFRRAYVSAFVSMLCYMSTVIIIYSALLPLIPLHAVQHRFALALRSPIAARLQRSYRFQRCG